MSSVDDLPTLVSLALEPPATFPDRRYPDAGSYLTAYIEETLRAANSIKLDALGRAAAVLVDAYARDAIVFACGNGGSAAIANHVQCDQVKGVRSKTDLSPRVVSLSSNVELLTAIANDLAFEDIFAYQLQSQARAGDVFIAVSSSGRSPNITRALSWARDHELHTIALTGFDGGEARDIAEVSIHVEADNYGIIEDLHQAVMHALAQYIQQSRMTTDAISSRIF
jgi:D-sedoheptulose 7-phosphate isomerase/D-glycero-D-manno-heptose 1,7-bisphosphate phosphatase